MDVSRTGWHYTMYDIASRKLYRDMTSADVAQTVGVKERRVVT